MRLVTQSGVGEGILQLCLFGEWVTACGNSFDNNDAKVVCSQLGFPTTDGGTCSVGNITNV